MELTSYIHQNQVPILDLLKGYNINIEFTYA